MSFENQPLAGYPKKSIEGEVGHHTIVYTAEKFEAPIDFGVFVRIDKGIIKKLDNTTTQVIAGVSLRDIAGNGLDKGTLTNTYRDIVEYVRWGECRVRVKAGEKPEVLGKVYVDKATGEATTKSTDIDVGAEFIRHFEDNTWLIRIK